MRTTTSVVAALTAASGALALTGDTKCSRAMCVNAFVNGTDTVTYELTVSQGNVGWMAMGFGTTMIGSPIVLLYTDANGQTQVSQRLATAHADPPIDPNPPRIAKGFDALKSLTSSSSTLAFTIPANTDSNQNIIWSYSTVPPTATLALQEHDDKGTMTLNLLNPLDSSGTPSSGGSGGSGGSGSSGGSTSSGSTVALTYNQSLIAAHGIMMSIVFLFLLPFGALLARLARSFIPTKWFLPHSIIQGWVSGPLVLVAFILAVVEISRRGGEHLSTPHKKVGVALFVLYIVQASLGTIIHFFKPSPPPADWHPARRRSPQNYLHAILGLTILGLGFYQVRLGYKDEWPSTQDMDPVSDGVDKFWTAWVVIVAVFYIGGLALVPRQWDQEHAWANQAAIANKYGQHVEESTA